MGHLLQGLTSFSRDKHLIAVFFGMVLYNKKKKKPLLHSPARGAGVIRSDSHIEQVFGSKRVAQNKRNILDYNSLPKFFPSLGYLIGKKKNVRNNKRDY